MSNSRTRRARKLRLVDSQIEDELVNRALRVGFATKNQQHVDQHFGSCASIAIYLVTPHETHLHEVVAFETANQDGNEDKLAVRIEALEGCAALYCQAIGASAIAQLKKKGVQPLKVTPNMPITAQLQQLRHELRESPAFWMLHALEAEKDASRFDDMEAEGWVE